MLPTPKAFLLSAAGLLACTPATAQFMDSFDQARIDGWFTMTGDGTPRMSFTPMGGFARIHANGTQDPHNVWWVLIKRDISGSLDLAKLADPAYELRVEARVRTSAAPRRVNFMLNTQRTTDFHEHLREYDLADTTGWHTISMTTRNFDAVPGDSVFVQLGVTDFGPGEYDVDIDYYRADVVRRADAGPDLGEPLVYHPPVAEASTFNHHLGATHDSVVHTEYPRVNFNDWSLQGAAGPVRALTVAGGQWVILRWDFAGLTGREAAGPALLEMTTAAAAAGGNYVAAMGEDLGIEFGKVRVFEILGGDPAWQQDTVSLESLLAGRPVDEVINGQMTIDLDIAMQPGAKTWFTLPRPVVQRLLDGTTKGLVLRPLGAISATFFATEHAAESGPRLHFSTKP